MLARQAEPLPHEQAIQHPALNWEVDELLRELARRAWMLFAFGDRLQPNAIAAVSRVGHWADVVVIRGHDRAAAYRALVRHDDDPLTARWIVWHYIADPTWTIRAALTFMPSAMAERAYPAPMECWLPEAAYRPVTIRPGGLVAGY
jgi:hypothetical protein